MSVNDDVTVAMTGLALVFLVEALLVAIPKPIPHPVSRSQPVVPNQIFELNYAQHAIVVDRAVLPVWLMRNRSTVKILSISPEKTNVVTTSYLIVYTEN